MFKKLLQKKHKVELKGGEYNELVYNLEKRHDDLCEQCNNEILSVDDEKTKLDEWFSGTQAYRDELDNQIEPLKIEIEKLQEELIKLNLKVDEFDANYKPFFDTKDSRYSNLEKKKKKIKEAYQKKILDLREQINDMKKQCPADKVVKDEKFDPAMINSDPELPPVEQLREVANNGKP